MRSGILGISVFLISMTVGCAMSPVREAKDRQYTSDTPPLELTFAYYIDQDRDHGRNKQIIFTSKEAKPIWVELYKWNVPDHRIDYFNSLEQIAFESNFILLGDTRFNGKRWVKVAKKNGSHYLMCGYMTRKGKWLIFVHNYTPLTNSEQKSFQKYQKTLKLADTEKKLIDLLFANLEKTIVSIN